MLEPKQSLIEYRAQHSVQKDRRKGESHRSHCKTGSLRNGNDVLFDRLLLLLHPLMPHRALRKGKVCPSVMEGGPFPFLEGPRRIRFRDDRKHLVGPLVPFHLFVHVYLLPLEVMECAAMRKLLARELAS